MSAQGLVERMRPEARRITITPRGDYDHVTSGWLVQQVEDALLEGATAIHIDLDELTFGGSTLISDILRSRRRCEESGAAFSLTAASDHWHRLFRIAGVSYLLDPRA